MSRAGNEYLLRMKQIEGRATRVQKYDRAFFVACPVGGIVWLVFAAYASNWDWGTCLVSFLAGALVAAPLAILLRNVP